MPGIGRRGMFCRALAVLALALCCVLTLAAAGADSPKIPSADASNDNHILPIVF